MCGVCCWKDYDFHVAACGTRQVVAILFVPNQQRSSAYRPNSTHDDLICTNDFLLDVLSQPNVTYTNKHILIVFLRQYYRGFLDPFSNSEYKIVVCTKVNSSSALDFITSRYIAWYSALNRTFHK